MQYNEIPNAEYQAMLTNWKLEMNTYLDTPEVILSFDFLVGAETVSMDFKSLLLKQDGSFNKKTVNSLAAIGFDLNENVDPRSLNNAELDTAKQYQITIGDLPGKNGKSYKTILWVNSPGQKAPAAKTGGKSLDEFFAAKPAVVKASPKAPSPSEQQIPW